MRDASRHLCTNIDPQGESLWCACGAAFAVFKNPVPEVMASGVAIEECSLFILDDLPAASQLQCHNRSSFWQPGCTVFPRPSKHYHCSPPSTPLRSSPSFVVPKPMSPEIQVFAHGAAVARKESRARLYYDYRSFQTGRRLFGHCIRRCHVVVYTPSRTMTFVHFSLLHRYFTDSIKCLYRRITLMQCSVACPS